VERASARHAGDLAGIPRALSNAGKTAGMAS
jgi:hypothetical protein